MELSDYRRQIDDIDSQLLALFYRRMDVAAQIGGYKKAHNLPALDAGRERAKLQQIADSAPEALRDYTVSLYSLMFELSRSCQNRLLGITQPADGRDRARPSRTRRRCFRSTPLSPVRAWRARTRSSRATGCSRCRTCCTVATFEAVFSAIEKGLCRYGVIPVENSTAGSVNAVYDLMMRHNFRIVRSVRLKVDHCLLARPGATDVGYPGDLLPRAGHQPVQPLFAESAGREGHRAARIPPRRPSAWQSPDARMSRRSSSRACIGALRAGDAWPPPCRIRATTTPALSASPRSLEIYPGADRTSLMMVLPHKPGSLYKVLSRFYALGINLNKLESRPLPEREL